MYHKIILLFLIVTNFSWAQVNDSLRDNLLYEIEKTDVAELRSADSYFKRLEYLMAFPIYEKLYEKYKNPYIGYLLGSCCAFESHNFSRSETLITKALPLKPYLPDYAFYYAKSLSVNDKPSDAINEFNDYLKKPIPEDVKNYVLHEIESCKNNISSKNKVVPIKIKNIGHEINTVDNEYSPVFPGDESFMVYTYRGEKSIGGKQKMPGKKDEKGIYFEDIYISYKDSLGHYQKGVPITELNSRTHESASYITHDGQKIYLYKNINGSGEIYFSKKMTDKWTKPERLSGICSKYWEGSCCFSPDEKTIYFSSDRPGGLGGRDIWKSKLQPNGQFEKPVNIGAPINTSSDEDSPFITFDGKLFYFSSNDGHASIGGYDIFKSEIKEEGFSVPENIGKPLNTIQDDKYLVISPDGKKAYYSSDHMDGFGQQDIYEIDRGSFEKPASLIFVSGNITYEGKPVEAKIYVNSLINKNYFSGDYLSEIKTGDYFISLPGKSSYELLFEYKNIKSKKHISAPLMDTLAKLVLNVELTAEDTLNFLSLKRHTDSVSIGHDITTTEFIKLYGNRRFENTCFKIQIGAYQMPENFNYGVLIGYPVLNREKGMDGITRFTVGEYNTASEAYEALDKVAKIIAPDAFILAYKNNTRLSFKKLITP